MPEVHAASHAYDDHDHDHHHDGHDHPYGEHGHSHDEPWYIAIAEALHLPGFSHQHDAPDAQDAMYSNELGIRTLWVAFTVLGLTTVLQVGIYLFSDSVALLADTVHNLGDALNSLPLLLAFMLMRRAAKKGYTYGYGRAEDLAGLVIVASILFSAGYIFWESINKLINPQPIENLPWLAAAALIGFVGNELVALMQIRVGRQIGSEAMIADGKHARTDGFTSLAVLIAAGGAALGYPIVDPIVGLLIGFVILMIAREATVAVWRRLMDAVDPILVTQVEELVKAHAEVRGLRQLHLRYVGHRLHASMLILLDDGLTLAQSEAITDHLRHHLIYSLPHLEEVTIASSPLGAGQESVHHGV